MSMMLKEKLSIKKRFKILNMNHVAVATENSNLLKLLFSDILGMNVKNKEYVDSESVQITKVFADDNKTSIEIVEPINESSPINKFLVNKGKGIHHIALTVDNIYNAIEYMTKKNIKLVYNTPQEGSDNTLITFIHPKSSPGILIELCQKL